MMKLHCLRLRPRSPWRTPWQADTLTGALCVTAARIYGSDFLRDHLIEPMLAGAPPFVLSDAFPGDLLPLPAARRARVPADHAKSLKRARWISHTDFVSLITDTKRDTPWDRLLPDSAVFRCDTSRHNTLARDSDASLEEGGLFSRPDTCLRYSDIAKHLALYFRTADGQAADLLLGLLHELALTGFGADTATGRGQFDVLGDPEPAPNFDAPPAGANTLICLSTFQPAPTDPVDGLWEVFPKFGKLGPDLGLADIRKRTLIMFRPGACFRVSQTRPFVGRALPMDLILPEASAADLRARHQHHPPGLRTDPARDTRLGVLVMTSQAPATDHILLVCTVGGTPEPLVKALLHWRPDRVLFIPSEQSGALVDVVVRKYAEGAGQPLSPGCYRICPVGDAEDLSDCLRVIRSLGQEVCDWVARGTNFQVVADFTAGTKCMSATLALQARRWRCRFSYVGGAQRTKNGIGTVETGSERVVHSANPWDVLGYQAIEDAVTVFNHDGYAAAAHLLGQAVKNAAQPEVKRELATLQALVDAYAAWDRFDHKTAETKFGIALKNRNDLQVVFTDAKPLIGRIERHRERVAQLAGSNGPTIAWVADLLHNAQRRAGEQRFDDAVARLYRAIEAIAQIRLRDQYNILDTKAVPLDKLPDTLRQEWAGRAREGAVMLGLRDAYRLLNELGDDLSRPFVEAGFDDDQHSPLVARNASILAHGFETVGNRVYEQLLRMANLLAGSEGTAPDWRLPMP